MTDQESLNRYYDFDVPETSVLAGVYPAFVTACEIRDGAVAPYFGFTFEIAAGESEGEMLWYNLSLSSKSFARRRAKRDLEALLGRTMTAKEDIQALVKGMPGRECQVVVRIGEYQGEMRPEIQRILPAARGAELSAAFGEATSSKKGKTSKSDEEEIPF